MTPRGAFYMGEDWPTIEAAVDRINAYRLVRDGIASYTELGVRTTNGVLPAYILQEHAAMKNMYAEAYELKKQMEGSSR